MKKFVIVLLLIGFTFSCSTDVESNNQSVLVPKKDTIVEVQTADSVIIEPNIRPQVSESLIARFSKSIQLPFSLSPEELEAYDEESRPDYFDKLSNELSSEEIESIATPWLLIGTHNSQKHRIDKAVFFAKLKEEVYKNYLDSADEWDIRYAKAYTHGSIELKNDMKVLVWKFRSGYGDGGTSGSFNAYFGSLIKNNELINSFELGYYVWQGDYPMSLKTTFSTTIDAEERFKFLYESATFEETEDTTLVTDELKKEIFGLISNDSLVLTQNK